MKNNFILIISLLLFSVISFAQVKVVGVTSPTKIAGVTDPSKVAGVTIPPIGGAYYVDKNATGTPIDGTTWDKAWRSFSAIVWASLEPGDFVYISGRDTGGANDSTVYYETLEPQCQGTSINQITIIAGKYSPSPSGHSGRVIIDGQAETRDNSILFDDWYGTHTGANNAATLTDAEADFIPDALIGEIVRNVTKSDPPTILCQGTITDNTITTITVTLSGAAVNDWDFGDAYSIVYDGTSTATESPRYVTVKGLELREATGGVEFNIDDATIPLAIGNILDSLYIYDWYDLAGVQVQGNTDSLIVQNCRIITFLDAGVQTDCFHFNGTDLQHARRTIIRDNIILNKNQDPLAHNDAIQSVIADGFQVYRNIIVNDSVYSSEGGGLPFILGDVDYNYSQAIENRNPVILAFNFCYMGGAWYPNANQGFTMWTRYYSDEAHQPLTYIINNTVVTNGPRVAGMGQEYEMNLVVNNINAMYCLPDGTLGENWRTGGTHGWQTNFAANSGWSTAMPMDSIRNNLFWKEDNTQTLFTGGYTYHTPPGGTGGISGWSDWLSKGGTGLNADPLFVQHFGHEPNQSVLIPDYNSNSPAIDAGEDIQPLLDWFETTWGIVIPNTDIYNNAINGTRDIGAYEYVP